MVTQAQVYDRRGSLRGKVVSRRNAMGGHPQTGTGAQSGLITFSGREKLDWKLQAGFGCVGSQV